MRPRGALVAGVLGLIALGGCVLPPQPFTEEFYEPLRVRRAAIPATPVTVFAFVDERPGNEPTVVVRYEPLDGPARVERATVPVGQGVARAFVRGLAARGYTVTDASARRFTPGDAAPAQISVTGRVADFGVHITRAGWVSGWESRVGCRLIVDVWEGTTLRKSGRMYQQGAQGGMMPAEPLAILAQALADVVAQAVADPELQAALRPR
jgi:hypothetical protein